MRSKGNMGRDVNIQNRHLVYEKKVRGRTKIMGIDEI